MYLFKKCGLASFRQSEVEEEAVFGFADKIKAFDIDKDREFFYIHFPYEFLGKAREYLDELKVHSFEIEYKADSPIKIGDNDLKKKIVTFIETLENLDDVHKVFANFVLE